MRPNINVFNLLIHQNSIWLYNNSVQILQTQIGLRSHLNCLNHAKYFKASDVIS